MIKLIVCDLDGTLLPKGQNEISQEIVNLIKSANKKGISFAVASGRSYHELKRFFEGHGLDIIFVPSDGAVVVYKEKTHLKKTMQPFAVRSMVNPVLQTENLGVVLSGKYISYIISKDKAFVEECALKMNGHLMEIDELSEITEDICKISFYGEPKTTYGKKVLSGTFSGLTKLIYQNNGWTEFISAEAGKEKALCCMTHSLKISPLETLIIGDGMNDVEILKFTENSFAVADGHCDAIAAAKHITGNVPETLKEIIRKGDI